MESELLTLPEVASRLRVHERTVYKLLRQGILPGRKVGRTWRVPKQRLEEWLNAETTSVPGDAEAILRHAGAWQFAPGELDQLLTEIEELRESG